ncbi:transmembrane protein 272-like [Cheilinus undulatus]|uniref:transmembrane protein 272-like n=1 Tax=Cheilinus undulatus TaxID=241271 RepID=UPI001BD29EF2|nr:transmembrane protein 272-like [Cheilinus undulatus]
MDEPSHQHSILPAILLVLVLALVNVAWWATMIAAIVVGGINLSNCPLQPYIPIYLIVFGVSSILSLSLSSSKSQGESSNGSTCLMTLLHIFNLCWIIAGSCWIYPIYPPKYDSGVDLYCHRETYLFAFGVTTLVWVALAIIIVCSCCCVVLACCGTAFASSRLIPSRYSFHGATTQGSVGDV